MLRVSVQSCPLPSVPRLWPGWTHGAMMAASTDSPSVEPWTDRKARVLIVEDEAIIAWQLSDMVEDLGHEVCGTVAGEPEAVAAAAREKPDLILMDVRLRAGGDGITAAETIRKSDTVPIVFCTAYATDAVLRTRMNAAGAAGVLSKPVSLDELRDALEQVLRPPRTS